MKIAEKIIERAANGNHHSRIAAKKLSRYTIYPLTFGGMLGALGFPLSSIGAAVGLIGLGVSFAMKDIISNFFSGVLLMVTRPFEVGDQIKSQGHQGVVEDVKIRATEIKTFDGKMVIIPNSKLYNDVVVNNTGYNKRRLEVVVGVGYDDDIDLARDKALQALKDADSVSEDPEPEVLVEELAGSSVNLKLRGWTERGRSNVVQASSEVTDLVKKYLDEEGIDIPYPIRTIKQDGGEEQ